METVSFDGKKYEVDALGYLLDPGTWDESFARGTAAEIGIEGGLTEEHWKVIHFLRRFLEERRSCPLVYATCRNNGLRLADLERLFPSGYQRGACRLAGFNYQLGSYNYWFDSQPQEFRERFGDRVYRVDAQGFLLDPEDWTEAFAAGVAAGLKMPRELTERHWNIIRFLRDRWAETGKIPTAYQTCERFALEVEDLETLFPHGYHRGAVKLAGLRLI